MSVSSNRRADRLALRLTVGLLLLILGGGLALGAFRPWARQALGVQLITAVRENEVRQVNWLLNFGADVNAVDPTSGSTPLSAAVGSGSEALPFLLQRGDLRMEPETGPSTALLMAVRLNERSTVRELLDAELRLGQTPSRPVAQLSRAAILGDHVTLMRLISSGVDPDAREKGWPTPLGMAAMFKQQRGVDVLLRNGADPDGTDAGWVESFGFEPRPLMMAARANSPEIVEALLDAGASLTATADKSHGPVFTAVASQAEPCVHVMMLHSRSRSISQLDLKEAHSLAKQHGNTALVRMLD